MSRFSSLYVTRGSPDDLAHPQYNNVTIYCSCTSTRSLATPRALYCCGGGPCTSRTLFSNFSTINPLTLSHTDWIAAACKGEVNA